MSHKRITAISVLGLAAAFALSGCAASSASTSSSASPSSARSRHLTVYLGDATNVETLWTKTLIPAFEKANPGYKVSVDFDLDGQHQQETVSKITAATADHRDPGIDLTDGETGDLAQGHLLAPATVKQIPNLKNVPAAVRSAGGPNAIPYRASSVVLAYNAAKVPDPPKTFGALLDWIKAHPGQFAYNSPATGGAGQGFVETVLTSKLSASVNKQMVDGYHPELEKDWAPGWAVLKDLNPFMFQKGVYPNGMNQVFDLLNNGEISMAPVWSDQFTTAVENGQLPKTIKAIQLKNPPMDGTANYLGIPKSSPAIPAAYKLANFLLSPGAQNDIVNAISGYPAIPLSSLPAAAQKKFKGLGANDLRLPFFTTMLNDMNQQWSQNVPGK